VTVLQPFTASIDWGHAVPDSLGWIARAWVISAVCVVVVLVVLRFTTTWGRQYWRITGDYFTGRRSVGVWLMLGVLLLSPHFLVMVCIVVSLRCGHPAQGSPCFNTQFICAVLMVFILPVPALVGTVAALIIFRRPRLPS